MDSLAPAGAGGGWRQPCPHGQGWDGWGASARQKAAPASALLIPPQVPLTQAGGLVGGLARRLACGPRGPLWLAPQAPLGRARPASQRQRRLKGHASGGIAGVSFDSVLPSLQGVKGWVLRGAQHAAMVCRPRRSAAAPGRSRATRVCERRTGGGPTARSRRDGAQRPARRTGPQGLADVAVPPKTRQDNDSLERQSRS